MKFTVPLVLLLLVQTVHSHAEQWLTFGMSELRQGYNPTESTLSAATVPGLTIAWQAALSGPMLSQPVLASAVSVDDGSGNLTSVDLVFAADLNGQVKALDAKTGSTVWVTEVPAEPGCSDFPGGSVGVIGTPTIDRRNNRIFLVAADGSLFALALDTGRPLDGYPLQVMDAPNANGVTLVYGSPSYDRLNGILYVVTGGQCDLPGYKGQLIQIDVGTDNAVPPSVVQRWFTTAASNADGGGIWGPGGVSIADNGGAIFAATGNALTTPENIDYANHVVQFDSDLNVIGSDGPSLPGEDVDFGATPLLFQPPGCPMMVAAMNKSGRIFVYSRSGEGLNNGPFQRIDVTETGNVGGFIGIPAYDPRSNQIFFGINLDSEINPVYTHGLAALQVQPDCTLAPHWVQPVGVSSGEVPVIPATVANGVVYYVSGPESILYAFSTAGTPLWSSGNLIRGGIYAAPTVVNGMVLVADYSGNITAFALPQ